MENVSKPLMRVDARSILRASTALDTGADAHGRVQMTWTGNYGGFGTGSLDRDVAEMSSLIKHLRSNGKHTLILWLLLSLLPARLDHLRRTTPRPASTLQSNRA